MIVPRLLPPLVNAPRTLTAGVAVTGNWLSRSRQILEAGLIDDFGPEDLGIANLHGVFRGLRIVGLRCKIELPDSVVVLRVAEILVARRQRVVLADLVVQTRAEVGAVSRVGNRIGKGNGATDVGGIEDQGIDGRKVIDIPPLDIKERRKPSCQAGRQCFRCTGSNRSPAPDQRRDWRS